MSTYMESPGIGLSWLVRLVVTVVLLSGCSSMVPLNPKIDRSSSTFQIPFSVGVYYAPGFRVYEHQFYIGQHPGFNVLPGKASIELFDEIFQIMFKKAVPVISRPPLPPGSPNVVAVIEPKIEKFELGLRTQTIFRINNTYDAEITYRFILYTPEGNQIVSSTYTANETIIASTFHVAKPGGEVTNVVMQEAAKKFMSDFPNLPQVQQWIRQAGVADAK